MADLRNETGEGGIGLLGLLTVVFVVLKLTDYIDWSWWWVTLPLWGLWVPIIGIGLVVGVVKIWRH